MASLMPLGPSAVRPFIEGRFCNSLSERRLGVINPSTGAVLLEIPAGCSGDVDLAVSAARDAFERGSWSDATPSFRKAALHRLADLLTVHARTLDMLDAEEMGKPVSEQVFSATVAAGLVRFYAEAIDKVLGDVFPSDANSVVMQRRVARGVVGAIVPWNFPTFNAVLKVAPALAAGNCVVLKPSELSSRSALVVAELAVEAGLPVGVLNVVPGVGEIVGQALGRHEQVDMVTFTGSTSVGKRMLEYSAQSNMKVVMAECGGKSPQILFDDGVDIDTACRSIALFLLTNQGQLCSVGSRLLVQRSIESEVVERTSRYLSQIRMGDARDVTTTFGPLVSEAQCMRVMQYIMGAVEDKCGELVVGGKRALVESGGYFIEPTLFRDVPTTARLAKEEIFGPVLVVIPFDDESDAIRVANSTSYGLASYVWTASLSTGLRMAKRLRTTVLVNSTAPIGEGAGHAVSAEPARQSGLGAEGGLAGLESYLRRQLVWINHS